MTIRRVRRIVPPAPPDVWKRFEASGHSSGSGGNSQMTRFFEPKLRHPLHSWVNARGKTLGNAFSAMLFRADGTPRALIATLLFDRYRRPRSGLGALVFKKPGVPRRAFAGWVAGADAARAPVADAIAWPTAEGGAYEAILIVDHWSEPARRLLAGLSGHRRAGALVLEGTAPAPAGTLASLADRVPRDVLLAALARRAASERIGYAVVMGRQAPMIAEALDLAGVAVVLASASDDASLVDSAGTHAAERLRREAELILTAESRRLIPDTLTADDVAEMVRDWRRRRRRGEPIGRHDPRRPFAGFHPLIYAEHHADACINGRRHPLAHWIEAGMPSGPWAQAVILPSDQPARSALKVALHGHFHYVDLLPEMLERLSRNDARPDLFLTTDTEAKAEALRAEVSKYPAPVAVVVGPQKGRDIGPFFTGLREPLLNGGYDVVVHVHGKKSLAARRDIGGPWRTFLLEHLIGGAHPMLDTLLARFAQDPTLGLVYADDPHLIGWARNGRVVGELRAAMGLTEPMDGFVDFPVGNMFAARPAALRPVLDLDLAWDDYPAEPVPADGTLMHGLERLLPMAVRHAGFSTAVTHVPGADWD